MTHCHGHTLQLAVLDTIKTIKIMIVTLDAAFELNKLIKYSMVFKPLKKNQMLSKKGRSFQQAEGRHGTRKLWRQRIRTKSLDCQKGIAANHFR